MNRYHAHPIHPDPDEMIRDGLRDPSNWVLAVLLVAVGFALLVTVIILGS